MHRPISLNIGDNEPASDADTIELGGTAVTVELGFFHACAIMGDQKVRCWGLGNWGALGYGTIATVGDDETPASMGDVALR